MQETHGRSIVKSLTWRVVATLTSLVVAYGVTGSVGEATTIALVAAVASTLMYYFHERAWNSISWGRR